MSRIKLFAMVAITSLLAIPTAWAEEKYTAEDASLLQGCIEAVRDISSDPEATEESNYRECIGVADTACQSESTDNQTTLGMANCAARETAWWDDQLNSSYMRLEEQLDEEEFAHLRDAQRAWIDYKDAKCAFETFYWREGTIRMIVGSSCLLETTASRAIDLMAIIDWTEL